MSQRNCSKDGPTSSTNPEKPENIREGRILLLLLNLFCALFCDPHLRTFKDHFQTCKVEGAWPLIDNNYLSVQVTNVPVVPGSSATATNKPLLRIKQNLNQVLFFLLLLVVLVFVSLKPLTLFDSRLVLVLSRFRGLLLLKCKSYSLQSNVNVLKEIGMIFLSEQSEKVCQAVTDDLPAAFVDGTTSGGDGNTKSLRIVEKVSGKYIRMHTRYVGTMVYILCLEHYLTLAIRMAQELVMAYEESQNLQLCVNGCPSSECNDGSGPLPLPTATTKCHEKMLVKDTYFYSCVFDLLTTGDANFTAAYRITASQSYRMWRHCTPEKSTGISSPAVEVVVWARVANSLSVWDLCA
ncbi:unnamed protein product [Bubo scandiacus]